MQILIFRMVCAYFELGLPVQVCACYCFFFYTSCSSLYTCHGRNEETVFKNQNVLSVVNMYFLLMTFIFNLTVTCLRGTLTFFLMRQYLLL